jgi:hypothetical protein
MTTQNQLSDDSCIENGLTDETQLIKHMKKLTMRTQTQEIMTSLNNDKKKSTNKLETVMTDTTHKTVLQPLP